MMKFRLEKYPLLCLLMLAMAFSCRSQYEVMLSSADVDAKYKYAFEMFEAKKYRKAAALFESLSMQTSGTEKDDTVRYYWALSNYKDRDILTAEANFAGFLELYPQSPFSSEATFLKLDCMYRATYRYELDQNPSRACIAAISEYIIDNPSSDRLDVCHKMMDDLVGRLDKKAFANAYLYYKMEDYMASVVAFKNVLKDNSETPYREDILYYIAKSSYKYAQLSVRAKQKDRYLSFLDEYYNFVGELPESSYRKDLDQCYARAMKAVGGEAETTGNKELRQEERADKKLERQFKRKLKEIKI